MKGIKYVQLLVVGSVALCSVASAAFSPKIASRGFDATVANICLFQGGANPNTDIKTDGNFFANLNLGTYRANAPLSVSGIAIYDIKCTKGASFTRGSTPTVTLSKSGGGAALLVNLLPHDSTTATSDGADLHSLKVDATANAGQWAVTAGQYSGTASWNVDYN